MLRLDYLSCVLTITSTILVGRRCWEGWLLGTVNSVIMCIIGVKTGTLTRAAIGNRSVLAQGRNSSGVGLSALVRAAKAHGLR